MQCHTESISFGLFLYLNMSETPGLSKFCEQNFDETLFLLKLFNTEVLEKILRNTIIMRIS